MSVLSSGFEGRAARSAARSITSGVSRWPASAAAASGASRGVEATAPRTTAGPRAHRPHPDPRAPAPPPPAPPRARPPQPREADRPAASELPVGRPPAVHRGQPDLAHDLIGRLPEVLDPVVLVEGADRDPPL